jgi:peroxiredoxin
MNNETPTNRRKTQLLVVALLMLTLPAAHYLWNASGPQPRIDANLKLQPTDGAMQSWSELRGRPLVVSFWATSCVICMHELEDWKAFYSEQQGGLRFELIAVAMSHDRPDDVIKVQRSQDLNYPVYFDLTQDIAQAFGGVIATPSVFVIDRDGTVVERFIGRVDFDRLRQELDQLV